MPEQIQGIVNNLKGFGAKRLAMLAGIAALVMATIAVASIYLNRPAYETLYVGLERSDVNQIGMVLGEAGISFDVGSDGGSVLVAAGTTAQARMLLAEKGLPLHLPGAVRVGGDHDVAAPFEGEQEELLGRVLALGPAVDLDRGATAYAPRRSHPTSRTAKRVRPSVREPFIANVCYFGQRSSCKGAKQCRRTSRTAADRMNRSFRARTRTRISGCGSTARCARWRSTASSKGCFPAGAEGTGSHS